MCRFHNRGHFHHIVTGFWQKASTSTDHKKRRKKEREVLLKMLKLLTKRKCHTPFLPAFPPLMLRTFGGLTIRFVLTVTSAKIRGI